MIAAPLPANERERLTELYALQILDTPREDRFDSIVRLTRHLFRVPIAYIALVDADRQWFKSQEGLSASQTGRAESFCGHAILQDEPLIVPDARLDQRFADNPLVLGDPLVRFYAGHPLKGRSGLNVGTLCLVAHEPREMASHDVDTLRYLAYLAEQQLHFVDVVASQRQLLETQKELALTQQRLKNELDDAADYICSLLPDPLTEGPVKADYFYTSSSELGGDLLGYHWLDDRYFVCYLLDVCGHGVGSALLASTVQNALGRGTLPHCDFLNPASVIQALDEVFPMDEHQNKFFTIWYSVYDSHTRTLRHASAGHPPAWLFAKEGAEPVSIGLHALMIGVITDREPLVEDVQLGPGARLYIFSDGAFELTGQNGQQLGRAGLATLLSQHCSSSPGCVDAVGEDLRRLANGGSFPDDVSIVELVFE